jgi:hypothetical protein
MSWVNPLTSGRRSGVATGRRRGAGSPHTVGLRIALRIEIRVCQSQRSHCTWRVHRLAHRDNSRGAAPGSRLRYFGKSRGFFFPDRRFVGRLWRRTRISKSRGFFFQDRRFTGRLWRRTRISKRRGFFFKDRRFIGGLWRRTRLSKSGGFFFQDRRFTRRLWRRLAPKSDARLFPVRAGPLSRFRSRSAVKSYPWFVPESSTARLSPKSDARLFSVQTGRLSEARLCLTHRGSSPCACHLARFHSDSKTSSSINRQFAQEGR